MKETIYIGIDIAKYKHDFCIISSTGEVIVQNNSFENNKKGFQLFFSYLKPYNKADVQILFESTAHYSMNLELELIDQGYSFMKMNGLIIKQFFKAQTLRKTKTDKADAFALTQYLMANTYKPNSNRLYHIYSLKSLCRTRDRLVRERSKFKIYITNELDKSFPEIKKFFDNKISITLLYILEKYKNKNKIALMKDYDSIRKVSAANFSFTRFLQLKQLAKESIGHPTETSDFLIQSYVKSINFLSEQIDSIEKQIIESVRKLDTHILSIPGIAEISAGSIIAEFGDIKNFESPEKMLAFAGLEPSIRQSGTLSTEGHMVKHGSGYLRNTIMRVVNSLVMHDQVFYDYYNKKRDEGKHHLVAQSHVAKKLIRIIYTLEIKGIDYDINFVK
ncbi:MAG: IS110 family transposase [Bacilli bacterium]|nr:IS110 family transposase [Bacilli bacterium]